jgi:uncharacterized protein YggU (UPF0235/DUF167 family)
LTGVTGVKDDRLLISVTSVPENDKANTEVIRLLSKVLEVPKTKIGIISGAKCRIKILCIDGVLEKQSLDSVLEKTRKTQKNKY